MRTVFKLALTLILITHAAAAYAQTEPKPMYFDFSVLGGYRTSMSFTTQPVEGVDVPKVVIDPSPSYGVSFGARLNDLDVVEFRWARMKTTMRTEQNFLTTFQQDATVDQYHFDFTHEYVLDNWPEKIRPFIMGSVGATHVSGSVSRSFTRFSFGLGAGVKVFATRHVGFRVQGEWLPILVSPEVGFICGGGCIVRIRSQLSNQGEFAAGPLFRF